MKNTKLLTRLMMLNTKESAKRLKYSLRKPTDDMKKILKDNLLEDELPYTLLIEQVPENWAEDYVRRHLVNYIQETYGVEPSSIGRIPYFTLLTIYKIIFWNTEDCSILVGKTVVLKEKVFTMYRPPIPIPHATNIYKPQRSSRYKSAPESEQKPKKRGRPRKVVPKEEDLPLVDERSESSMTSYDDSESESVSKRTDSPSREIPLPSFESFETPRKRRKRQPEAQEKHNLQMTPRSSEEEYIVDHVVSQRWVGDKVQYLLNIVGEEGNPVKLWIFDDALWKLVEMNRLQEKKSSSIIDREKLPHISKILDADMRDGFLYLYVQWANTELSSWVPANVINKIAPEKVIQFYEDNLISKKLLPLLGAEKSSHHVDENV